MWLKLLELIKIFCHYISSWLKDNIINIDDKMKSDFLNTIKDIETVYYNIFKDINYKLFIGIEISTDFSCRI